MGMETRPARLFGGSHSMSRTLRIFPGALILAFAGVASAEPTTTTTTTAPAPAQVQAAKAEALKLSDAFVSVAEKVSPAVVQIDVTTRDDNEAQLSRALGLGDSNSPIHRGMGSGVL